MNGPVSVGWLIRGLVRAAIGYGGESIRRSSRRKICKSGSGSLGDIFSTWAKEENATPLSSQYSPGPYA